MRYIAFAFAFCCSVDNAIGPPGIDAAPERADATAATCDPYDPHCGPGMECSLRCVAESSEWICAAPGPGGTCGAGANGAAVCGGRSVCHGYPHACMPICHSDSECAEGLHCTFSTFAALVPCANGPDQLCYCGDRANSTVRVGLCGS